MRLKILIVTESAILPTGMAEVIRLIFGALLDRYPDSYELHQIGLFHSHSVATPRWPVYPTRKGQDRNGLHFFHADDRYGQRTIQEVLPRVQPDIVFAHNDPQRILHLCMPRRERSHELVLCVNFDGFPLPPDLGPILNQAERIVTQSEFSKRVVLSCLPAVNSAKVDFM